MPLCVALVHHPVVNKHGETVTSSVTNFDIHDIARSCRTFGVDRYFVVTPSTPQQWLARRIVRHWLEGWGAEYNHNRREALELIEIVETLEAVQRRCMEVWGRPAELVGTSARPQPKTISGKRFAEIVAAGESPVCLVFGTAWGLHPELTSQLSFFLEPISGVGEYNHLSVRAAVAITLDRLCGRRATPPDTC